MELRYLYVGSSDTGRDLAAWLRLPDAHLRWRFRRFGADVAAIDLGVAPTILLADHRPAGTVLPIYAVGRLGNVVDSLAGEGWTVEVRSLATPEGPAAVLTDASGTHLALLQVDRPDVMDGAYAASGNPYKVEYKVETTD